MAVNIGLGYEAQLVGQVLQQRLIGAAFWTTVDSPVTAAKYRLDSGGTIVRLHYIGPWSMSGATVIGPTGNTTSSANFAANRTGSGGDWTDQSAAPNIQSIPALTFNPNTTISVGSTFTVLDSGAIVNDGGNTLGAIRITLGPGIGSLGVISGGGLTTTGTIGTIAYLYEPAKRLLSLTSLTATGADFTQVLRLVGYGRETAAIGALQSICVNLGKPIYATETGHYYEVVSGAGGTAWNDAKIAANAKNFFGLTGYLATVTSQPESNFLFLRFKITATIGGSSAATPAGTIGSARIWKWETGPEIGQVFWNGASTGLYHNWFSDQPRNGEQPSSTTNITPCVIAHEGGGWYDGDIYSFNAYYVEYSTASGTGDDGLSGTRSIFNVTVQSVEVAALIQASIPVQVSLVNGAVISSVGVAMSGVTIGATNATHIQVSIDLGTNNAGKRRQARGFRLIGGAERELIATRTQVGEVYNFVFLKTVDGSNTINLLLN